MLDQQTLHTDIMERVENDASFRKALLENPQATLKAEFGINLTKEEEENFSKKFFFYVPAKASAEIQGVPVQW